MSAVAMIVQPENYVLIAGDGAASHPTDGTLAGQASKILLLPELNAAMGVTGIHGIAQVMHWHMPLVVTDFDELLEVLPDLFRHSLETVKGIFNNVGKCAVAVGGWSDRHQRYEGWRVTNYEKSRRNLATGEETPIPAFTMDKVPDGGAWSSAGPGADIQRKFGTLDGPESDTDVELIQRMICAARADSGIAVGDYPHFNAGVFLQLACVQRNQVQSWITHRWPEDVVGESIDPTRGQPMPDHLMAHYDAQA